MDVGLLLGVEALLFEQANHMAGDVILAFSEAYDDIVLNDVVKVLLSQPSVDLFAPLDRDGCMDHHLTGNGKAIDIQTFDAHLVHKTGDELHRELVLLGFQAFDVGLSVLDLLLNALECAHQITEVLAGCCIDTVQRTGGVEHVFKKIVHKFVLFRG